jgi:membrane protein implicated in regulation of membrane protease activity
MLTDIYTFSAVIGGTVYFLLMLLMLLGFIDLDFGDDFGEVDEAGDTDGMFKFLSVKVLAAFTMMFGLIGLGTYEQLAWPAFVSIPLAFAAGFGMVKLTEMVGRAFYKLENSGDNSQESYVGHNGEITVTITTSGTGLVNAQKPGSHMEFGCVSEDGTAIQRGTLVDVVGVQGNYLVVKPS